MLDGVDAISTSVPSMSKNHAHVTSACGGRIERLPARGRSADRCTRHNCLRSPVSRQWRTTKNFPAAPDCGGIDEHSSSPSENIELANQRAHDLHSRTLARGPHGERNVKRFGTLLDVVWIHDQRLRQLARGSSELAQDENACVVVPRCDELFRDQIHSVMKAAHKAQLGGTIVLVNFDRLVMLHEENDRRMHSLRASALDRWHT